MNKNSPILFSSLKTHVSFMYRLKPEGFYFIMNDRNKIVRNSPVLFNPAICGTNTILTHSTNAIQLYLESEN